jgi:hypothetical protein
MLIKTIEMKNTNIQLILFLIIIFFQISCAKDDLTMNKGDKFYLKFSDGTTISENDIEFYDTSSHLLFLKHELLLNKSKLSFNAIVDKDTIYHGVIFPAIFSSRPSQAIFILDQSMYGNNIIHIDCYIDSFDFRNDQRIINALRKSKLLRYGLTCTIDNIEVTSNADYSSVNCTITVKNNDNISYYIPDPAKMGELDFNYYMGGLFFDNLETKVSSFIRWSVSSPDCGNVTLNNFSILKAGQKVKYTFKSSDYYKMDKGIYNATFRFCGFKGYLNELELNQRNGRIWLGSLLSVMEGIDVNK